MDTLNPKGASGAAAVPTLTSPPPAVLGVNICHGCGRRLPLGDIGECRECVVSGSSFDDGKEAAVVDMVEYLLMESSPSRAAIIPLVDRYCSDTPSAREEEIRRIDAWEAEVKATDARLVQLDLPARFAASVQAAAVSVAIGECDPLAGVGSDYDTALDAVDIDCLSRRWRLAREIADQHADRGDVAVTVDRDDLLALLDEVIGEFRHRIAGQVPTDDPEVCAEGLLLFEALREQAEAVR